MKKWVIRKVYHITKDDLLSCCDEQKIVDVKLVSEKFNIPIRAIKRYCVQYQLKFKNITIIHNRKIETIQCPVCSWSGSFKFSIHVLNSKDELHKSWIERLRNLYLKLNSSHRIAELEEFKNHHISRVVIASILDDLQILKKHKIKTIKTKCPVCDWENYFHLSKHFRESKDEKHELLKQDVIKKYLGEKITPYMIGEIYKINVATVKAILEDSNIKIRNLREATIIAITKNRRNRSYGIGGYRKDLNRFFRSIPEANFARVLKYHNIEFENEVPFNLYDENKKIITTYFLDFLINKEQGIEIKGFEQENGDFKNREKIILFMKQYPNIKLKVIFCNSEEWKETVEKYSVLIPLWETQTKNLKTHPNLYT